TWRHGICGFCAFVAVDVIALRVLWPAAARRLKVVEDGLVFAFAATLLVALDAYTVSRDTLWWQALLTAAGGILCVLAFGYILMPFVFAFLLAAATRPFGASDAATRARFALLRDKIEEAKRAGFVHVDTIRVLGRGVLVCFQHIDQPVLMTLSTIAIEGRRAGERLHTPVASLWTPYACDTSVLTVSSRRLLQAIARDGSFVQVLGEGPIDDVLTMHQAARRLLECEGL